MADAPTRVEFREPLTRVEFRQLAAGWVGQDVPLRVAGRVIGRATVLDVTVDETGVTWAVQVAADNPVLAALQGEHLPPFSFRFSLDGLDVTAIEARPRDPLGGGS